MAVAPEAATAPASSIAASPLWHDPAFVAAAVAAIAAIAVILGALILGGFVMRAVQAGFAHLIDRDRATREEAILGVLQALHDEMDVVWKFYVDGLSAEIRALKDGAGLWSAHSVQADYFSIFNANASLVGHIQPTEFRKLVVETYTQAKILFDMARMNNGLVAEAHRLDQIHRQVNNHASHSDATKAHAAVVEYARKLKSADARMHALVPKLLLEFERRGAVLGALVANPGN
jgi:hypothetical protein